MKNLFYALSFGLAVMVSSSAIAQDNKGNNKKQKTENTRSNGKSNPNRKFGKDRAGTVQEMNNQPSQSPDTPQQAEKRAKDEAKKIKMEQKNAEKQSRKAKKERLKAEKKMVKKNKTRK